MDLDRQASGQVNTTLSPGEPRHPWQRHRFPILGVAFILFGLLAGRYGPLLWQLLQD